MKTTIRPVRGSMVRDGPRPGAGNEETVDGQRRRCSGFGALPRPVAWFWLGSEWERGNQKLHEEGKIETCSAQLSKDLSLLSNLCFIQDEDGSGQWTMA